MLSPVPTDAAEKTAAVALLASAIGAPVATVERLLGVASALVEDYAVMAPTPVKDEAVIRCAGALYQAPQNPFLRGQHIGPKSVSYQPPPAGGWGALRRSGAMGLLSPWRVRRAGASLAARAFASAKITPPVEAVTPLILSTIGREIIRRGECLFLIDVDGDGLRLLPSNSWDVTGGVSPQSWTYRLDLAAPDSTRSVIAPAAGVVHIRAYVEPSAPWRGISPLTGAASTARLLAETEAALADESSGPRGHVIPMPQGPVDDDDDGSMSKLQAAVAGLKGKTVLVETAAAGFGEGRAAAPAADWQPRRIGAAPPDGLQQLRTDAEASMLAASGTPIELISARSDGAAVREAWRRYAHAFLTPIGGIVATELADKLERPGLALDFSGLFASDITGRARAFASMVNAGMDVTKAAGLSGLLTGE